MEQLAPAASVAPQALAPVVIVKSSGLLPPMLGTMLVSVAPLLLVSVAANAAEVVFATVFGKLTDGVKVTGPEGAMPVPSRIAVCGDPVALSATESTAEKPLTTDGVKVM
jgi:hypothetical protein